MTEPIRIPNIEDYTMEIINGQLIVTPKEEYITETELEMVTLTGSTIEACLIKKGEDTISTENKNWRSILLNIYKSMQPKKILQNTTKRTIKPRGNKKYLDRLK